MKYCRFCGKHINRQAKFCVYCGKNLVTRQPSKSTQTIKKTQNKSKQQNVRTKKSKIRTTKVPPKSTKTNPNHQEIFDSRLKPLVLRMQDKLFFLSNKNKYLISDYFQLQKQFHEINQLIEDKLFQSSKLLEATNKIQDERLDTELRLLEYLTPEFVYDPLFVSRENWYDVKKQEKQLKLEKSIVDKKLPILETISQILVRCYRYTVDEKHDTLINPSIFYANYPELRNSIVNLEHIMMEMEEIMEYSPFNEMFDDTYQTLVSLLEQLGSKSINHCEFSMNQINSMFINVLEQIPEEKNLLLEEKIRIKRELSFLLPKLSKHKEKYVEIMKQIFDSGLYKTLPRKIEETFRPTAITQQVVSNLTSFEDRSDSRESKVEQLKSLNELDKLEKLTELQLLHKLN